VVVGNVSIAALSFQRVTETLSLRDGATEYGESEGGRTGALALSSGIVINKVPTTKTLATTTEINIVPVLGAQRH
jgi:hypothetical protein